MNYSKKYVLLSLVTIAVVIIVVVGIYFTRLSSGYRLFRISGETIGDYKSGSLVIAKKVVDPLSLSKGDAFLYEVEVGGKKVERFGIILALPSESKINRLGVFTLDQAFLIGRDSKVKDLVEKEKINWIVIKKF